MEKIRLCGVRDALMAESVKGSKGGPQPCHSSQELLKNS